jgi:hypothetical protein
VKKVKDKMTRQVEKSTGIKMPEPTGPGQVEHPKNQPMGVYGKIIRKPK